jgi:hypothetical protein
MPFRGGGVTRFLVMGNALLCYGEICIDKKLIIGALVLIFHLHAPFLIVSFEDCNSIKSFFKCCWDFELG